MEIFNIYICKSGVKIQSSQLKSEFDEEVIQVNTARLERYFSNDAWVTVKEKGRFTIRNGEYFHH